MIGSTGLWLFMIKYLKVVSGDSSLGDADEVLAGKCLGDGSYFQGAHSVSRHMFLEKYRDKKCKKKITA